MALVTEVFDALSKKLQKLQFSSADSKLPVDENSCSSCYDHFTKKAEEEEILPIQVPLSQTLDIIVLEKKIGQLIQKLNRKNLHLHVFDHTDIQYGPILGKGGEGVVQRCRVLYNNLHIDAAVKTVLNSTEDNLNVTLHEIELLCLAKDPIMSTVIQVYGVAAVPRCDDPTRGHLVIVTEVGLKNLLQLYQAEAIPLHVTLQLWHDLAIALHFLHCKHIIHQDLKPENILITSLTRDRCGTLVKVEMKIIDLGLSLVVDRGKVETDDVFGTVGYHAPEVLFDDTYDFKADIFVLAMVFCVMLLPRSILQNADSRKSFLTKVHTSKKKGLLGSSLYFSVVQDQLDPEVSLPSCLVQLICKMLEKAEDRDVNLLDIATLCISQATLLHPHHSLPSSLNHTHDSGVMSDNHIKNRGKRRLHSYDDDDDEDEDEPSDGSASSKQSDENKRPTNRYFKFDFGNDFDRNGHLEKNEKGDDEKNIVKEERGEEKEEVNKSKENQNIDEVDNCKVILRLKDPRDPGNVKKEEANKKEEGKKKEEVRRKEEVVKREKAKKKQPKEPLPLAASSAEKRRSHRLLHIRSKSFRNTCVIASKRPRLEPVFPDHKKEEQEENHATFRSRTLRSTSQVSGKVTTADKKTTSKVPPEKLNQTDANILRQTSKSTSRPSSRHTSTRSETCNTTCITLRSSSRSGVSNHSATTCRSTNAARSLSKTLSTSRATTHATKIGSKSHKKATINATLNSTTTTADARVTRSKPRQFFSSVVLDEVDENDSDDDEEEKDDDDEGDHEEDNCVFTPCESDLYATTFSKNLRSVTKKITRLRMQKEKSGKVAVEMMKMPYHVSKDNILDGKEASYGTTLTRSALKRRR